MKKEYAINNFYQGGYSSLNKESIYSTGYSAPAHLLGASTKPDTANQIAQITSLLNQGIIPIEVGAIVPQAFETIPKQHFKEMNRMAKLTGAKLSLHAPLVEPSGIGQQGYDVTERLMAENQFKDVVEKAMDLNDKGGTSVTFHPLGQQMLPGREYIKTKDGKKLQRLAIINQETGQIGQAKEEYKFYPGENLDKGVLHNPIKDINTYNNSEWVNKLTNLESFKKHADEIIEESLPSLMPILSKKIKEGESLNLTPEQQASARKLEKADIFLHNVETSLNNLFHNAWKYSTDEESKKILKGLSENWAKKSEEELRSSKTSTELIVKKAQLLDDTILSLKQVRKPPRLFVPLDEYATEKAAETFANVAVHANEVAKKQGKNPVQINIENLFPGTTFGYAEQMDKLITTSRDKFVDKLKEKGFEQKQAEKKAQEIIGMTFDLGHLNLAKKYGYEDEDLRKEAEQIAKHVKHVHVTDNFGFADSHLAPGMGNVPTKILLEELEKQRVKDPTKIVEAGGVVQHFNQSPLTYALEGMNSNVYSEGVGPYWSQTIGLYQGYGGEMGTFLPNTHYETFGAGFSMLPRELGGAKPGAQGSRMSGRGME